LKLYDIHLKQRSKETHPQEIDLYDIFCAILYRLREGCRWRSLPHDFPKWQICYYHYNVWRNATDGEESVFDRVLRELVWSEPDCVKTPCLLLIRTKKGLKTVNILDFFMQTLQIPLSFDTVWSVLSKAASSRQP